MKKILGFVAWLFMYMPIMTIIYLALFDELEHIYPKGYWYYAKDGFNNLVLN